MTEQTEASLTEQVYVQLKADILNNHFPPGAKLNVAKLKERYETGSAPIREALNQLKGIHFVRCERLKGFFVSPVDQDELLDLYATRKFLENEALIRAIKLGDDEWEANCLAKYHCLHKLESHEDFIDEPNFPEWMARIREFFLAMLSGCHSPTLLSFIETLLDQSERYRYLRFADKTNFAKTAKYKLKLHKQMIDACLKRDPVLLAKVHAKTLDETIEFILKTREE